MVRSLGAKFGEYILTWLLTVLPVIASWSAITLFAYRSRSVAAHRSRVEVRLSSVAWSRAPRRLRGVFAFAACKHGWSPEVLYAHALFQYVALPPCSQVPATLERPCVRGQNMIRPRKFVCDDSDALPRACHWFSLSHGPCNVTSGRWNRTVQQLLARWTLPQPVHISSALPAAAIPSAGAGCRRR